MPLKKGLKILSCFDFGRETISAKNLSEELGLPLSTIYRYLAILIESGYLSRNGDSGEYRLGLSFFRLGRIAAAQFELIDFIKPYMERLSSVTEETSLYTVIDGFRALCVERVETQRRIRMSLQPGMSLPLHAGASSKVLLAYQSESFLESMLEKTVLERFTSHTITDPVILKSDLKNIRQQGFAFSDQEADVGARAIAAPIFDSGHKLLGSLSIAGPANRITDEDKSRLVDLVVENARDASNEIMRRKI